MFSKKLAILGVAALTSISFAPAFAGTAEQSKTVEVDISTYDMTTEAGASLVYKKIERAAETACGTRSGPQSLSERRVTQDCVDVAIDNALNSLVDERAREAAIKARNAG